jgi:hypothetical protein
MTCPYKKDIVFFQEDFEQKVLAAGGKIPHSLKDPSVIVTFVMSAYR